MTERLSRFDDSVGRRDAQKSIQRAAEAQLGQLVASACGHPQAPPTDQEIDGCPEIIVRNCPVCERALWWNVDQWRKV